MSRKEENFDNKSNTVKMLMLGGTGVGKTCLLSRFVDDYFTDKFVSTVGIDFRDKKLKLKTTEDGEVNLKLRIWDTAGQERFRAITAQFYRGAHGIMLVYDVTDAEKFQECGNWMQMIKKNASADIAVILVANKIDFEASQQVVTNEEGKKLADSLGIPFCEASAKTGKGVTEAFELIASLAYQFSKKPKDKPAVELSEEKPSECAC